MPTSQPTSNSNVIAFPLGPGVRRVVTGHTAEGKAIVLTDANIAPRPAMGRGPSFFTDLFWTDAAPADNGVAWSNTITAHPHEFVGPKGSSFRALEFPPGKTSSTFYRTVTLDYGILVSGTLTVVLNGDERVTLNAGDVLVQRGTIHSWNNEGTEWARMLCVMLPAKKVKVGDKELEQVFLPPKA